MVYNESGHILLCPAWLHFGGAKGAMRMPGPFPGMNPYLEDADLWRDLHHTFITYARAGLRAVLPPGYLARIEERVVILPDERSIVPDVFVRRRPSLSPALLPAPGIAMMEREDTPHRVRVTSERAAQVAAPLAALEAEGAAWDYLACLHRAGQQRELEDEYEVWFIGVRQPLPRVRVPLDTGTPDVLLDLQAVLDRCYDEANYGGELDYTAEPTPPLRSDDAQWADALLRQRGLRP